ncbi:MAG: hypothetical protein QE277_06835 [Flectobacillus sp.]|jgi:hypothetical protein|nr:hypothetical protein [Flectobacillus sp.]
MITVEIDRLTNSIVNARTGDILHTEISPLSPKEINRTQKEWSFDWKTECSKGNVFKLFIEGNPNIIQGLISLIDQKDHIYVSLVENAPFNIGANKVYEGVAGNLFAYACKLSFELGYEGYISFHAKSELIDHYIKTLGAKRINNQLMYIDTVESSYLVNRYFKI